MGKGSKTESATEEEEEVVKPNVQKKITAFFSSLKTKEQKKGVDDTLATEWEKVSLVDEKEKKAEEKEKTGLASKVTALLTKLRPEKKEEEVKEEEVKEEEEKKDEEKKVEEEKEEEKPSAEEKPVRRGS